MLLDYRKKEIHHGVMTRIKVPHIPNHEFKRDVELSIGTNTPKLIENKTKWRDD
jgi:hypothetical protein